MGFTQATRRISIDTPLGQDVLLLTSIDGVEQMSRLFAYRVRMLSEDDALDPSEIVGQGVTVTLLDVDDEPRFINGYVRNFVNQGHGDRATLYTAEIVPWPWFLTRRTDCRIFQKKTIPQIIEEVFQTLGFADFDLTGLTGTYEKREFTVQYRETDFDFVSRLMEHEGIFYFFRHEDTRHVLVLGDSTGVYAPCKNEQVRFAGSLSFTEVDDDLTAWEHRFEYRSGRVSFADFNFETPQRPIVSKERTLLELSENSKYELYDYPGDFLERDGGDRRARLRMQEEEGPYSFVVGASKCRSFNPGGTFTIAAHHQPHEDGQTYVITAVRHRATAGDYVSGGSQQPEGYTNEFECIPAAVLFRPPRLTPKSLVRGPQTAIVVGPAGEEIYTDNYGRIKVQFHWDRYGQNDENSSCWMRVSQAWAGGSFGFLAIPRIGQEVVVEFLEGDPDRPIITGRVYNAEQMQSHELPAPEMPGADGPKPIGPMQGRSAGLPAAKSRTSFRTNSTPGGGAGHEITMDDSAGSELMHINSSKDMVTTVANDQITSVGNNQELSVAVNQTEFVGSNRTRNVGANESITIGVDQTNTIGANRTETVGADETITIGANRAETVAANETVTIGGNQTLTVGKSKTDTVGGALSISVTGATTIVGNDGIKISSPKTIEITSTTEIKIGVGTSTITLKPDGVEISGAKITSSAVGVHEISGALVKIN